LKDWTKNIDLDVATVALIGDLGKWINIDRRNLEDLIGLFLLRNNFQFVVHPRGFAEKTVKNSNLKF
jgi:hypothetical protein